MAEPASLDPVAPPGGENLVPRGAAFSGLLAFDGDVRVDGDLEGRVRARGSLRVGPSARVRADIEVDELIVEGSLDGDVRARRRIVLGPAARVRGRLETPRLAAADGCQIDGHCTTGSLPTEAPAPEPAASEAPVDV